MRVSMVVILLFGRTNSLPQSNLFNRSVRGKILNSAMKFIPFGAAPARNIASPEWRFARHFPSLPLHGLFLHGASRHMPFMDCLPRSCVWRSRRWKRRRSMGGRDSLE